MFKVVYNLFVNLLGINVYMLYNFFYFLDFWEWKFLKIKERFRVFFRIDMCLVGIKVGCWFLILDENRGFVKFVFMSWSVGSYDCMFVFIIVILIWKVYI